MDVMESLEILWELNTPTDYHAQRAAAARGSGRGAHYYQQ